MHCRHCDSDNSATNAFCEACGKPLEAACPACGQINRPGSHFCGRCSAPLGPAASTARPSAEGVLRALSASGGERKRLTVIFADISNSTGLIDRSDPEDAMGRMQPAIDAMRRAVDHYDGVVNKVTGDGIMALFGAPRPHEDHAVRACAAALAMQASVSAIGDPDLKIRVGIHTGEVVVQAVENSLYQTYDVAGSAAHLAARMEQMAEAGEILLTGDTAAATGQYVEATSFGLRAVRGLSEPVEVFKLLGLRHAPASVIFRSQPHLSQLTGRTAQFNALEAELANAANSEARVVGVVGEAGSGKSRLCFEFAESCRKRGICVYETRVMAHGHATPYQPILELLRDYLGIKATQPPDEARRQVAKAIANLPAASDTLSLLLDFLGLTDAAHPAPRLDPATQKTRLIDLVRNIVRCSRPGHPAVVLIEDLHWIDAASAEFVEAMVDAVIGTTTLLLFNFRYDYVAAWMQRAHHRQVSLSALNRAEANDLLCELLGRDTSLALISRHIAERAQGNPFFIEELVHSLVERGDFEGTRGAYRLAGGIGAIPLPATIEALLAARIDHLDEPARQVLQCAAVIGREVPVAILESVTGLKPTELAETLGRLRRAELLRELPLTEPALHAFGHPLIQEVCYRSLLRERRRKIHAEVARAIKLDFSNLQEERISLLAYHLEGAGELMEAAQANMRAAFWIGGHDSSQGLRSWTKSHQLLSTQPVSESVDFLRMQACLQIMAFGWREGTPTAEAQRWFEEARQLALAAGNMRASAWAHAAFGRILAANGSADDYVMRMREALALAIDVKDGSVEPMLMASLSQALRLAGHLDEALKVSMEAASRAHEISGWERQLMGFDAERWLTVMQGQILVLLGRFDEARPFLDRMLQADAGPNDATLHLANVAYVDLARGTNDKALAEHHAERAMRMAVDSDSPYERVSAMTCRGISHMTSGRFEAAADQLEKALAFARMKRAGLEGEARILADLADAYRLKGDLASAGRLAAEAIAVASARAARMPECLARIVQAEVLLQAGAAERAGLELPKIRTLMEQTGALLYQPMVRDLAEKIELGLRHSRAPDPVAKHRNGGAGG
jgi:class 3 adenylate cyclase/tetratricopeptide (TPR) repeat protein